MIFLKRLASCCPVILPMVTGKSGDEAAVRCPEATVSRQ